MARFDWFTVALVVATTAFGIQYLYPEDLRKFSAIQLVEVRGIATNLDVGDVLICDNGSEYKYIGYRTGGDGRKEHIIRNPAGVESPYDEHSTWLFRKMFECGVLNPELDWW